MNPKILYPSRLRLAVVPLMGAIGVALSRSIIVDTGNHLKHSTEYYHGAGYFLLVCSIVWVVVGLINYLPAACFLQLDGDGFTSSVAFIKERVLWNQVIRFRTFRFPDGLSQRMTSVDILQNVVADLDPQAQTTLRYRAQNREKWGLDVFLATNYGLKSTELAALLNEWKDANSRRENAPKSS